MATKDQTQANRANARRSTGPRTAAGKAKSSQNALKHGLRAQITVLPDENVDDFCVLVDELEDQFQPETAIEWTLLRQLADAEWRMRRVPCLEAGLIAAKINESLLYYDNYPDRLPDDPAEADLVVIGAAAASDANRGDTFSKLSRYEARLSHRYFKALEHLNRIQGLRNRSTEHRNSAPQGCGTPDGTQAPNNPQGNPRSNDGPAPNTVSRPGATATTERSAPVPRDASTTRAALESGLGQKPIKDQETKRTPKWLYPNRSCVPNEPNCRRARSETRSLQHHGPA